jgi:enoyl-CoA hydratase/carnithine racemase
VAFAEISLDGHIATLRLNRPEARNALSAQLCEDIVVALHGVEGETEARVLIVRGEGPAFCAGADLAAVSGRGGADFLPAFERMLESLGRCRLPTVASIHGAALGGGLQLASVCDFRLASDSAKIGIPSSKLGIVVNFENVQRLVLLSGIAVAKEVLMTGRTYSGAEAVVAGLINRSVPETELDAATSTWATDLAERAPLSIQGVKRSIQLIMDQLSSARSTSPELVAEIDRLVEEAYGSEDLQEGVKAMAEKRPPKFRGS